MIRPIALLLFATSALATPVALNAEPAAQTEAQSAREVAAKLASLLADNFVYVDTGKAYADMLKANAAAGAYDGLQGAELAQRLTADLQAVAKDGHLHVRFAEAEAAAPPPPQGERPPGGPPAGAPIRMRPQPIELERWIAPGIAFVRMNGFPRDPEVTARAAKFMTDYADAKAIIFDIRTHGGGGLDQMDAIFPWLFDKPTRLVTMATRQSAEEGGGSPFEGDRSLRTVEGDPGYITREHWVTPNGDKRLNKAHVYVLTSSVTGSAAEHFSLAMKHTGRGKLIGSHTGGANHFGGFEDLGHSFSAFVPVGRTYDPLTGKDWEGGGVLPDVDVSAETALVKALEMEGVTTAEAERLSAELPMPVVRRPGGPVAVRVRVPAPEGEKPGGTAP